METLGFILEFPDAIEQFFFVNHFSKMEYSENKRLLVRFHILRF